MTSSRRQAVLVTIRPCAMTSMISLACALGQHLSASHVHLERIKTFRVPLHVGLVPRTQARLRAAMRFQIVGATQAIRGLMGRSALPARRARIRYQRVRLFAWIVRVANILISLQQSALNAGLATFPITALLCACPAMRGSTQRIT